jgi:hypothetical protein
MSSYTDYWNRLLQEDLNVGVDAATKRNPAGGTLTGTQVGIHSFAVGQAETVSEDWAPGSIANGSYATKTVTVSGAAVGDYVLRSFTSMQAGLLLDAYVTASNTVTVILANVSGAAVTPSAGDISLLVLKSR